MAAMSPHEAVPSNISNAVAVANGKGGVGKSSITANVAGTAALSGWKVLAVDLDPQGNLGNDLGYNQRGDSDDGRGLLRAVVSGDPLEPLTGVRDNLDVVPGGEAIDELVAILTTRQHRDPQSVDSVAAALRPIAHRYQLILIDCPPAGGVLLDTALTAVRFLVIPTKRDSGSLDGFVRVARRFAHVRAGTNPSLELLGVVLFDFGTQDKRMLADTRAELERDLDGAAPVFDAFIRNSRRAPGDMRDRGLLAYEYEVAAAQATPWYQDRDGPRFSASAPGLAEDYQRLTAEMLSAITERRSATLEDVR
jgi:cellulose biosynthesis protein BcsQ